jgi:kynurenine 3-monooxygenase
VLAMYLARRGCAVDVFERHARNGHTSEQGGTASSINLTICERGFAALEELGVAAAVRAACVPARGRRFHLEDGRLLYQPYGPEGEALYAITRRDLIWVLLDEAERRYCLVPRFEKRCSAVDSALPAIRVQDGVTGKQSWIEASAVVGADGAFSDVRQSLVAQGHVVESVMEATLAYKQVDIVSSGGWTEERDVLHIWPRGSEMMLAIPNADGSFTAAVLIEKGHQLADAAPPRELDVLAYFGGRYPDAVGNVATLGRDLRDRRAVPLVTVRCRPWRVGHVLLVGDAAHGVFPSYGQGANAGFEDCAALDACLEDCGGDWPAAFTRFEHDRHDDTDAIADLSERHLVDLRSSMADPDWILRAHIETAIARIAPERYRPLYETIAFTTMPYAAAVARDRVWAPVVDYLLTLDVMRRGPDGREAEETIRSVASAAGLLEEVTAWEKPCG